MSRSFRSVPAILWILFAFTAVAGCGDPQPPIVRVGTNVVDKAIFQGSWYMSQVVVDTQYEAGSFPGDSAMDLASAALGGAAGYVVPRIRWVIDENYLLAYRDYEITLGGQTGRWREGDVRGQPIAAFRIESHFDIRRLYNTTSGEELNTVVENATDRRWYERKYMRVDWSRNLITSFYPTGAEYASLLHQLRPESVAFEIQEGGAHADFPASWKPQSARVQDVRPIASSTSGGLPSAAPCTTCPLSRRKSGRRTIAAARPEARARRSRSSGLGRYDTAAVLGTTSV